jgi:hypothetical protein
MPSIAPEVLQPIALARVAAGDVVQPRRRYRDDLLFGSMAGVDRLDREAIRVLEEAGRVPDPLRNV